MSYTLSHKSLSPYLVVNIVYKFFTQHSVVDIIIMKYVKGFKYGYNKMATLIYIHFDKILIEKYYNYES